MVEQSTSEVLGQSGTCSVLPESYFAVKSDGGAARGGGRPARGLSPHSQRKCRCPNARARNARNRTEASVWFGIGAPIKTPSAIVESLNKEVNAGLANGKLNARLANLGGAVLPGSPADFGKLVSDEVEKWRTVILAANLKQG
jgi:hypothetical protein